MRDRKTFDTPLTRRAFVRLAATGASAVALGGFVRLLGPREPFVRPPGALPEEQFLALCIRCDRCRQACPYNYITPVLLTESVISAGTPRLEGFCPRCWRCLYSCPVGALRRDI